MRLGAILLGVALVGPAWPQTGAGSEKEWRIEGQVVDSVTGAPIRKVLVRLNPTAGSRGEAIGVLTDADGRFTFTGTEPATSTLFLEHPVYRSRFIPEQGTNEQPITVGPGESRTGLVLKLVPFGVLTGRILDEDGDPVLYAQVELLSFSYTDLGRELGTRHRGSTNDLGEYRIVGVRPGRYYLRVTPPQPRVGRDDLRILNSPGTNLLTFYPASPDLQGASMLLVGPGQKLDGADITLRRGTLATVRGRVICPQPNNNCFISVHRDMGSDSTGWGLPVTENDGHFTIRNLPPGNYTVSAEVVTGNTQSSARATIQVGTEDIEGIELRPVPSFDVRGRLRFDGTPVGGSTQISVRMTRQDRRATFGRLNEDNSEFVVPNVAPDTWALNVMTPREIYVKSIRIGQKEYLDQQVDLKAGPPAEPVVVTFGTNIARVEGTVDLAGQSLPALAGAVLIPTRNSSMASAPVTQDTNRMYQLSRETTIKPDGRFEFPQVAPGTYRVYAWAKGNLTAALFDPDYLKPYVSYGADVTVGEGGQASVTVKLIPRIEEE